MKPRIEFLKTNPKVRQLLLSTEGYLQKSALGARLQHLVKVRASQINGCAHCLDIHTQEARADGESEQRLYTLQTWRETPFFDERERAALAWTEAVTNVAASGVPDEVYELVSRHFGEQELVDLTLAVTSINTWNRLNVAFRTVPGSYRPGTINASLAPAPAARA